MTRKRLPNRRRSETHQFDRNGSAISMTVGYFEDGTVGEIFVNAGRANSELDAFISDAAICISIALQYGASLLEIAHALKRDARGVASSPIGAALDRIAKPGVA